MGKKRKKERKKYLGVINITDGLRSVYLTWLRVLSILPFSLSHLLGGSRRNKAKNGYENMWNVERNEGYNGNGGGSNSNSSVEYFVQACGGRWYGAKSSRGLSSLLRYTFHDSPFSYLSKVVFLILLWYQLLWPIILIV